MADVRYYATSHSVNPEDGKPIPNVKLTGSTLQEQQTEIDAVDGVLTFSEVLSDVEIYNTDSANTGTFTVNGINIKIPPGQVFRTRVEGFPSKTVSVAGSTEYIISRYK